MHHVGSSKNPSIELKADRLGPAGFPGELHIVTVYENEQRSDVARLRDNSERKFRASASLSKLPAAADSIRGDFSEKEGSSYLLLSDDAIFLKVRCQESAFTVKKNELGELSFLESECISTSAIAAKHKFLDAGLPFLDYLSYIANCPLFLASLRIEDPQNHATTLSYTSPYRKAIVNPGASELSFELAPVYAMYREAKNSASDFYKFLCYYKILEGLLGVLRAEVFKRAKHMGMDLTRPRDTVPDSLELPLPYRPYVGKSVKHFFDGVLTPEFRAAVAHFVTDNGAVLNMSSPAHIDRYAGILLISELCVRAVISNHESLLHALQRE
jgi:hypothetical protein